MKTYKTTNKYVKNSTKNKKIHKHNVHESLLAIQETDKYYECW